MTFAVDLSHRFDGFTMEARFAAPAGVTALFGRSGSGKTTLVNAVAGLLRPDRLRVEVAGAVLADTAAGIWQPAHRRRIGYVFQDARLFPHLTVRQNLLYGRWFSHHAKEDGAELNRIIEMLGIGALLPRRPGALSGGEKQRVALGRAILSRPRLLLMDEPLAALDEARKAEILPYLERLRDEVGLPILYVSHAMAEVARLATTVVLLEQGRVTAVGPVAEVLAQPEHAHGFGLREAGALLLGQIAAHEADGLTQITTSAGPLWLPTIAGGPGRQVRLRILAQDVMLALEAPQGISALNHLEAVVEEVHLGDGPGAMVRLRAGDEALLARITARSARGMGLHPGMRLHAVLKAVSVAQENIGRG